MDRCFTQKVLQSPKNTVDRTLQAQTETTTSTNTETQGGRVSPLYWSIQSCPTDLVHVQYAALVVEACVELVEHGDDLHGRALRAHGREAHDVREEHGDVVKLARRHGLALPQPLGHVAREDGVQEVHRPPLLLLQRLVRLL